MNLNTCYLALDLEMNQPSQNITEIGVAMGIPSRPEVHFTNAFVKLPEGEKLAPFIIELCGIDVPHYNANAKPILEQWETLLEWSRKTFYPTEVCIHILTWGIGDIHQLTQQLKLALAIKQTAITEAGIDYEELQTGFKNTFPFSRRFIDVKAVYQAYCIANGINPKGGLKTALGKLGMTFEGHAHNAGADALNTLLIFKELLKRIGK